MKKIKTFISMIKGNLWSLVEFEFLFKILSLLIFTPLFLSIFDLIMKITGYRYLTIENIVPFLSNPLTIFLLFILIILMTVYTMFDITTIIILLDQSWNGQKMKVLEAIKLSLMKCRKIFHLQNICIPFLVLFLIPFLNIGMTSSFITTIKIPEFILEFIMQNYTLLSIFVLLSFILILLLLNWIYSLHYFALEDINFKEACKKSRNLSRGNHLKDICGLAIIQLFVFILYIALIIIGISLFFIIERIIGHRIIIKSIVITIIWLYLALAVLIVTLLGVPMSYAAVSTMYYLHKKEKNEEITNFNIKSTNQIKKENNKLKNKIALFYVLAIIGGSIFTHGLYKGKYNLNIEYVRTLEVTAHRGSSIKYPENTLSSFEGAKREGANWIELDVQQTKDKNIIVMHDTNLKRTAGINQNTWEVDYEKIKEIDVGSFLNPKFHKERIPLLKDIIVWAKKKNMKLNIELKSSEHEKNLEKKVIDMITELNYIDGCVITSQIYGVLQNVKKYNKKIKTVYVMSLAYGDITSLKDVDAFSIEATSITTSLVNKIHKEGKELYAWTVNTEENIRKMIDLKVDNIVTDDVKLAKRIIYTSKKSNLINEYIKWIEQVF